MRTLHALSLACFLAIGVPVAAPSVAQAAPALTEAAGAYAFSAAGSTIRFAIGQVDGGGLQGRFGRFSGTIHIDPRDMARSGVDITIVPASVATGQGRIDDFLKSNAVFDAANERAITFRSTGVQRAGQDGATVTGQLTARGKTGAETFQVTLEKYAAGKATFHVTGKVFRSRYGMGVGTPIYSNVVDFDMRIAASRR